MTPPFYRTISVQRHNLNTMLNVLSMPLRSYPTEGYVRTTCATRESRLRGTSTRVTRLTGSIVDGGSGRTWYALCIVDEMGMCLLPPHMPDGHSRDLLIDIRPPESVWSVCVCMMHLWGVGLLHHWPSYSWTQLRHSSWRQINTSPQHICTKLIMSWVFRHTDQKHSTITSIFSTTSVPP